MPQTQLNVAECLLVYQQYDITNPLMSVRSAERVKMQSFIKTFENNLYFI